jgi:drug/metabolite transporter (DMT)-like permease
MVWAALMFGEALTWTMAAGLVVSIAGIVIFAQARAA